MRGVMTLQLTDEDGEYLVRLARRAITLFITEGKTLKEQPPTPKLREKAGAFVTLKTYPEGRLRGCIGYPEPALPLYLAVIQAAISAATQDPRFYPVTPGELPNLTVEVSVLTPPEPIIVDDRRELPDLIRVGRDGLIIRAGPWSGLLLPQVPVEWGWDSREFLDQTCVKAGLPPGCWMRPDVEVFRFTAIVFAEEKPMGRVVRERLTAGEDHGLR